MGSVVRPSHDSSQRKQLRACADAEGENLCERASARRRTSVPGSTLISQAGASSCRKGCSSSSPPCGPRNRISMIRCFVRVASHFWHPNSVSGGTKSAAESSPEQCSTLKLRLSSLTPISWSMGWSHSPTMVRTSSTIRRPGFPAEPSAPMSSSQMVAEPSEPRSPPRTSANGGSNCCRSCSPFTSASAFARSGFTFRSATQ
mmetsp:Transcript_46365/g.131105  ORF Transcript_46365/g.131105 Transcript_46365/m.131105 type:complete len:202 (-) Transcript_46365:184-789(-)